MNKEVLDMAMEYTKLKKQLSEIGVIEVKPYSYASVDVDLEIHCVTAYFNQVSEGKPVTIDEEWSEIYIEHSFIEDDVRYFTLKVKKTKGEHK